MQQAPVFIIADVILRERSDRRIFTEMRRKTCRILRFAQNDSAIWIQCSTAFQMSSILPMTIRCSSALNT